MTDDARLVAAREFLDDYMGDEFRHLGIIEGLIAYAEERMRVNVGLVMENAELRRRVTDLTEGTRDEPSVEDLVVQRLLAVSEIVAATGGRITAATVRP
jgi:hypothetical protein